MLTSVQVLNMFVSIPHTLAYSGNIWLKHVVLTQDSNYIALLYDHLGLKQDAIYFGVNVRRINDCTVLCLLITCQNIVISFNKNSL